MSEATAAPEAIVSPTGSSTPEELLTQTRAPVVGAVTAALALGAPVTLEVRRTSLSLQPGSGLCVRMGDASEVALRIERLSVDLATLDVRVESEGDALGELLPGALSEALRWALPKLGWGWVGGAKGCSMLDEALAPLPRNRRGWRQLWSYDFKGLRTGVWVAPEATLKLVFSSKHIALLATPGLEVSMPGLALRIAALRHNFATASIEVELSDEHEGRQRGPRWLRSSLLKGVSWGATRWLSERLPPAMAQPGYDPIADPRRRERFEALIKNLTGTRGKTSPKKPPGGDGSAGGGGPLAALMPAQTRAQTPETRDALALFRRAIGSLGELVVCVDDALEVRRGATEIALESDPGVWIALSGHPWISTLKVRRVAVALETRALTIETTPPLGAFFGQLAQRAFDLYGTAHVERAIAERMGLGGVSDEDSNRLDAVKIDFGGAIGELSVQLAAAGELWVRRDADAWTIGASEGGARIAVSGLKFLPPVTLKQLRLSLSDARAEIDAEPMLDTFGQTIVTQLLRYRVLPKVPAWLGLPQTVPELDVEALRSARPLCLVDLKLPVLGPLEVRLRPEDTLSVRMNAKRWSVEDASEVMVLAREIDLTLFLSRVKHNFVKPQLDFVGSLTLGDYGREFLMLLLDVFAWPALSKHVPLPNGEDWHAFTHPMVAVVLEKHDALVLTRRPNGLAMGTREGVALRLSKTLPVPETLRLSKFGLRLPDGALSLVCVPEIGPLVSEALMRVARALAPAGLDAGLTKIGLPTLDRTLPPPSVSTDLVSERVLHERDVPRLGRVRVSLDLAETVQLRLGVGRAEVMLGAGLLVTCESLSLAMRIKRLSLDLSRWRGEVETEPSLGALANEILGRALVTFVKPRAARFLPDAGSPPPGEGLSCLAQLPMGEKPPLLFCLQRRGMLTLSMDRQYLKMESIGGLSLRGGGLDWLPHFQLTMLQYALGIGQISLDIEGIEDGHYTEEHDVSELSEQLIEHVFKALIAPSLPALLHEIGVVAFDDDEGDLEEIEELRLIPSDLDEDEPGAITLLEFEISARVGRAIVALDPQDTIEIQITHPEDPSEREAIMHSEEGLILALPGFRFLTRLHGLRYHLASGEVQVDGLGQFEDAMIEAIVGRSLKGKLGNTMSQDDASASVSSWLLSLPRDKKGRCVLFEKEIIDAKVAKGTLAIAIAPHTEFTLSLSAGGIGFQASPAFCLDGPAIADLNIEGLEYSFETASFDLELERNGALRGLLTGGVEKSIEFGLNQALKRKLPEAMRNPGYTLADDPNVTQTIAELIQSFGGGKGQAKT